MGFWEAMATGMMVCIAVVIAATYIVSRVKAAYERRMTREQRLERINKETEQKERVWSYTRLTYPRRQAPNKVYTLPTFIHKEDI